MNIYKLHPLNPHSDIFSVHFPQQLIRYIVTNSHNKGGNLQQACQRNSRYCVGLWNP